MCLFVFFFFFDILECGLCLLDRGSSNIEWRYYSFFFFLFSSSGGEKQNTVIDFLVAQAKQTVLID